MALAKYQKMRRFKNTPEPKGSTPAAGKKSTSKKLAFVVQKHHATQLHYDFRLELDGVLKSWAVPKGPSLNTKDKRLAMMVEDHPFEYRQFEGVIPEGNYGAGNVIIWDKGWYELHRQDESWPRSLQEGLKKGDLKFTLHGKKLRGSFALIKTPRMGDSAWLLIKHKDRYVSTKDITKAGRSVVSNKTVEEIGKTKPGKNNLDLKEYPRAKPPHDVKPMLATLVDEPFDKAGWLFEIKWDGYRAIGVKDGKSIKLASRNLQPFEDKYPEIAEALKDLPADVVVDGEIVAVDGNGRSHFEWLQNWGQSRKGNLLYYLFDILWCDGHDLTAAPLARRKQILKQLIPKDSPLRYSDHVEQKGKQFFKLIEKRHLEGTVAKDASSPYQVGLRSRHWLKIKTQLRQEVVIAGYTEPRGSRQYLGALLLGVYEGKDLVYVGHSGGGFSQTALREMQTRLHKIERKTSPFTNPAKPNAPVHWVEPKYVCEVSFTEWTKDGYMRHPRYEGLRSDKLPRQVKRELPKASAKPQKAKT